MYHITTSKIKKLQVKMLLVDKHIRFVIGIYFMGILNMVTQYENSDKFLLFLFLPCK